MRYLVTGMAGSLSQLTADALLARGHEVVGVDYRNKPARLRPEIQFYKANYNKTRIVDVFRRSPPDVVLHLGRVGNLKEHPNKRFDLNVVGSQKLMDLCAEYKVKRLVVLSTFHIYGAHPHNHIPIIEDEPLRAGQLFPQLADAVQLDGMASTWMYKYRAVRAAVLRPTNIVGPHIRNAIATYLRNSGLVRLIGFDPMWQFVHERDMVDALLLAAGSDEVGVFNVAGAGELPISEALGIAAASSGARTLALPGFAVDAFLRLQRQLGGGFPPYLLEFFKYACVISDERFRSAFGYAPKVGLKDTLATNYSAG